MQSTVFNLMDYFNNLIKSFANRLPPVSLPAHFVSSRGKASYRQAATNKTSKQINLIRWAGGAVSDEVYAILSTGNYPIMGQNMGQAVFEKIVPNFLNNKTKKSSGNLVVSGTFLASRTDLDISFSRIVLT